MNTAGIATGTGPIVPWDLLLASEEFNNLTDSQFRKLFMFVAKTWYSLMGTGHGLSIDESSLIAQFKVTRRYWQEKLGSKILPMLIEQDGYCMPWWVLPSYQKIKAQSEAGEAAAEARWNGNAQTKSQRKPVGSEKAELVKAADVINGNATAYATASAGMPKSGSDGMSKRRKTDAIAMQSVKKNSEKPSERASVENSKSVALSEEPISLSNEGAAFALKASDRDGMNPARDSIRNDAGSAPLPHPDAEPSAIERQLDWSIRQAAMKRTKLYASDDDAGAGMCGDDVRNAQVLLHTAARVAPAGERVPDMKITAQILVAVGGPRELIQMLAHLDKRDLSHVQGYGYFLKLAGEHRARQPNRASEHESGARSPSSQP